MISALHFALSFLVLACVAGCGGPSEPPVPEGMGEPPPLGRNALAERVAETSLVALVQSTPAVDGLATSNWVHRQLGLVKGEIMFPKWEAQRRGKTRYEVRFTYTLIDPDNRIVKRGYAWSVDAAVQVVDPPREIDPEYAPSFNRSGTGRDEFRRARETQAQLE